MSPPSPPDAAPLGARFTPPGLARQLASGLPRSARRILDPACGDGALLLAAAEAFPGAELHGIELDPATAARSRERLARALGGAAGERAARGVRCADGLDPDVAWPEGADVLANPPWVSLSGRQCAALPADRRERYRRAWSAARGSWPSLHGAFLERISLHLAGTERRARVLLPSSVGHQVRYGSLRGAVTRHARLDGEPSDLGEDAFDGVVEPAFLLELVGHASDPGRAVGSEAAWTWPAASPEERELLHRLARFPRLPRDAFGDPGVHTGNAAAELIVAADEGGTERSGLPGVRAGRDLVPYRLAPPSKRLRLDLPRTDGRRFRIAAAERYRAVPILLRQTADRPLAALHDEPTYFRNSLLACTPPPDLDPAFVVGVLNAPVAAAWHRLSFLDAHQRAFPQVKVGHLRTQPLPIGRRADDPRLHDRVSALVRTAGDDARSARRAEALVVEAFGLEPFARQLVELAATARGPRRATPGSPA